jgi:DNA-binding NarL/FixJ family response regulator
LNSPIRVALADDQALVRHGLRVILERTTDIQVLIDVENGTRLLDRLSNTAVDVVIVDIRMPHMSGIDVVRCLRSTGQSTPALLLTTFNEPELVHDAVAAGANGYLLKDVEPLEFTDGIRLLASGGTLFAPTALQHARSVVKQQNAGSASVTKREVEVLRLVAAGYSNKEIARVLNISDGTVKNHMTDIMVKLEARDRTHAVLRAIALRLL